MAQALATAQMLGGIQATLGTVQQQSAETLQLVRGQGAEITNLKSSDAAQNIRLEGHDREFSEIRSTLSGIDAKLDARGLTWPKLLAGGAALAAMLAVAISAIVAVSNGLTTLGELVDRVGVG